MEQVLPYAKTNMNRLFMQDRLLKVKPIRNLLHKKLFQKRRMFYSEPKPKQEKRSVSYGGYEKQKLFDMESALMEHYGYNYSQLIKAEELL